MNIPFSRKNVFKKAFRIFIFCFLIFLLLLFACFPARYMQACLNGINLWAICVLPSTLPFLFITGLLTRLGYVNKLSKAFSPFTSLFFNLSGVSGYCLLMSFLSGYPVGAKTLCDLKESGVISASEGTKMSFLCSSSGPLFILGSVGMGMFSSAKIGVILLIAHFAAILLSGIAFRFYKTAPAEKYIPKLKKADNILYECMYASVISVLCVGGFIAVFYTLSVILSDWHVLSFITSISTALGMDQTTANAFAKGLVEMTGGCNQLAATPCPLNIALCAFLITFGGISILFQQIVYLKKTEVKLSLFFCVKFLQAIVAGVIAFLLSVILITA